MRHFPVSIRPCSLLLGSALTATLASAQFSPLRLIEGHSAGPLSQLQRVDLDGDGAQDLVLVGAQLGYHPALAGGGFGAFRSVDIGPVAASQTEWLDIDGDADIDLVVISRGANLTWTLQFLRNDGAGRFGPPQLMDGANGGAGTLATLDVDLDGVKDAVASNFETGEVNWYRGLGAAGFAPRALLVSLPGAYSLVASDFDGDGDSDLVVGEVPGANATQRLFTQDGPVQFTAGPTFGSLNTSFGLDVEDIDGDGLLDLYTNQRAGGTEWLRNLGGGSFAQPQAIGTQQNQIGEIQMADMDGDGDPDLVTTGTFNLIAGTAAPGWAENLGGGSFGPVQNFAAWPFEPSSQQALLDLDLDGDGDLDLAFGSIDARYVEFAINDGNGQFGSFFSLAVARYQNPRLVRAADVDSDGDVDLVSDIVEGEVRLLENAGGGRFFPSVRIADVDELLEASLVDLDGDGDLDLVGLDSGLFLSFQGTHGFGARQDVALNASAFTVADFDGDGDVDLVIGRQVMPRLVLRANDGSGSFGAPVALPRPSDRIDILAADDLDGDGDQDLAVVAESKLYLIEQAPGSTWIERDGRPVFFPSAPIGFEDFDGDGSRDIALFSLGQPLLLRNDGFVPVPLPGFPTAIASSTGVAMEDIDGDGSLDAVDGGGGIFSTGLRIHYGIGTSSYRGGQPVAAVPPFISLTSADIDGDGVKDLVGGRVSRGIGWMRRSGAGSEKFCAPSAFNSTGQQGDLDFQGDLRVSVNDFTLSSSQLSPHSLGVYFVGSFTSYEPRYRSSLGTFCLGNHGFAAFDGAGQVQITDGAGTASLNVDLSQALPLPGFGAVQPGDSLVFQMWYRDVGPNGPASNLTSALRVTFD
ncbi:FG-GAP repeat protein [Planctomycetes bacterium Poly30]|uniref:FG-GAP repeat protein n=1 Tax=Saltatorellus ferox TaxID=2528018 RepID=A0A518ENG5_9BACT|nr:FG-GAP repeat protein [Planctomycetes bacterium Poly30]